MKRISVVVTVRNDRDGLAELLPALAAQTMAPDELIVVDGGSRDDTLAPLERWRPPFPVHVVVEPGANIAAGRNVGVQMANNDWIACTDAGCRPDPGWLAALKAAVDERNIVAGTFAAEGQTPFERVVGIAHYPAIEELHDPGAFVRASHRLFGRRFEARHAAGRSMAFSKQAWLAAGGFPERQYAGEDLAFSAAVIRCGYQPVLEPAANVRWRPPGTATANARMFFTYCRGDIRSTGRLRHLLRLLAWTAGPALFVRGRRAGRVAVLGGALAYIALPLRRAWQSRLPLRTWWLIPFVVALKDLSQLLGAGRGLVDAVQGIEQPNPKSAAPAEASALPAPPG